MKKIIYIVIVVIVLALIWFWLDGRGLNAPAVPSATPSPEASASPVSDEQLQQELDASLQGGIDSDFRGIDQNIDKL